MLITIPLGIALFWPPVTTQYDGFVWPVGLSLFFLGLLGRIWAQEHLHFRLNMTVTFTDTGPYGLVRNPIYIFNTLNCVALTIMSRALWLVPFTLIWCIVLYYFVVRAEEESMKQYGAESEAYFRNVPRWIPRFSRKPMGFINKHLGPSIVAELFNFLYLLPFIGKEIVYRWVTK